MGNIIESYCRFWDSLCGYSVDYVQVFVLTILTLIMFGGVLALLTLRISAGGAEMWVFELIAKFLWALFQALLVTVIEAGKFFLKKFRFFWNNEKKGNHKRRRQR